jgi:hypothetical protein
LRRFLGLFIYYQKFIAAFMNIAKPLTQLTKDKQIAVVS